jgi:hypothetical protein
VTSVPTLAAAHLSSQVRAVAMRLTRRVRVESDETGHTLTQLSALYTTDGRQSRIVITSKGRRLLESDRRRDAWLSKRFAELSSEEMDLRVRALPVLERLAEA